MRYLFISFLLHVLLFIFVWVGFSVSEGREQNTFTYLGGSLSTTEKWPHEEFSNQPLKASEAVEFENTYNVETSLGYDAPPKDPADPAHGGDDKFDVYIFKLGTGVYGYASPEDVVGAGDKSNERTSFMAISKIC